MLRTFSLTSFTLVSLATLTACSSDAPADDGTSGGAPDSGGVSSTTASQTTGSSTTGSPGTTTGTSSATNGTSTTTGTTSGVGGTASSSTTSSATSGAGTVGGGGASSTSDSSEASGTVGGSGVAPSAVSDLTISPNPNSVISCIVTWTTDQAANSVVQFGVGGYQWEISDATPTTDHRVVVIGMRREQSYSIKAISTNDGGSAEAEGEFATGVLPASIPIGTVQINDRDQSQPGWTLMNVQEGDGSTSARSPSPPMAVMYDDEGEPVWYFINGTINDRGGAVSTQLTDVGVLIGPSWNESLRTGMVPREVDFEGNVVWECPTSLCGPDTSFSHHASKLPNGHYLLNEDYGSGTTAPRIHELDHDGQEVWTMTWTDLLPAPSGSSGDWCHGNSISADLDNNILFVNCRWVGFMKVNYAEKTKAWLIPAAYGSKGQGDFTYSPADSQFSDAHDPEFHADDNTVLMFDNGGYGTGAVGGQTTQYRSRAVEYKVDEATNTLTLNWEFPGSFAVPDSWYTDNWYTPFWGDADRLPNGNVLVAAGIRSPTVESRVFEVTKETGTVVWELRLPPDYGVYRADRVTPPLVHAIP